MFEHFKRITFTQKIQFTAQNSPIHSGLSCLFVFHLPFSSAFASVFAAVSVTTSLKTMDLYGRVDYSPQIISLWGHSGCRLNWPAPSVLPQCFAYSLSLSLGEGASPVEEIKSCLNPCFSIPHTDKERKGGKVSILARIGQNPSRTILFCVYECVHSNCPIITHFPVKPSI